jgi:hypothetical protein
MTMMSMVEAAEAEAARKRIPYGRVPIILTYI